MASLSGKRCRGFAAVLGFALAAAGCTGGSDEAAQTTTSSASVSTTTVSTIGSEFTEWFNEVTAADASAPRCDQGSPIWLASSSVGSATSGPLLSCVGQGPNGEVELAIVNNASGPLAVTYADASARWTIDADLESALELSAGNGVLVRPGMRATMRAEQGSWAEQELTIAFPERWTLVEATHALTIVLGQSTTFAQAEEAAERCRVDEVASADLGTTLEARLAEYFDCVFVAVGEGADEPDGDTLDTVVSLSAQLVERSRNLAVQQEAGSLDAQWMLVAGAPEPAGPLIEEPTTTAPPVTAAPSTRRPTTQAPTTAPPTTQPPTTAPPTTVVSTSKVPTTVGSTEVTVPLPSPPVLVALETIAAGTETFTAWPAIEPKLGLIPGGQIVVIECRAFTDTPTPGGNGWWYRIGSGASAGGWASATGFENLVPGVAAGSTASTNVSDSLATC